MRTTRRLTPAPMPVAHVYLECTSFAKGTHGAFDTFVVVSEEALAQGEHLRIACWRAAVLGYGGPQRVLGVHVIGDRHSSPLVEEGQRQTEAAEGERAAARERLSRLLDQLSSEPEIPDALPSRGEQRDEQHTAGTRR